jgi:class 3 adenylate cyclase/tetratricopeptide (TPR) repeat protein
MFCDLVGSTAISSAMDPEEFRNVLAAYRSAVSGAIRPYDGHVAGYMGDGLLLYFGYPQAHEDDAERAVRAGLDIAMAVSRLPPHQGIDLRVRIGIATGLVVAGDMVVEGASEERAVLGDTPNLAARLQAIAAPNSVVLSDATRRLVEGRFELEALAPLSLKGFEGQVQAYRAVSVKETGRFEAAISEKLTVLSGRESELGLFLDRWRRARLGEGQAVLLAGEPGIGKSRLIQEILMRIGDSTADVLRLQCSPYHSESAFFPFIDLLRRAAGFSTDDTLVERQSRFDGWVRNVLPRDETAWGLLADLISLPSRSYPSLNMTPTKRKSETIGTLAKIVETKAKLGPVFLVFEDAHWSDEASRDVLERIFESIPERPVLCLVSCRPEFSPSWRSFGHLTRHSLNRLGRIEAERIIESVAAGEILSADAVAGILDRTDGIPLFVEELTKSIVEAGSPGWTSIPATLHDSLLARLDRLASAKEVAQAAACIGRNFKPELLAKISPLGQQELDAALDRLVDAELVICRREDDTTRYQFKHALMQDAAYESLLVSRRRELHGRIANAIENLFPDEMGFAPERLAQHYTAADMSERAIPYWLAAGRRALAGANLAEAESHLTKALELTRDVEDADHRADLELETRTALGAATMALHGWPADPVHEVIEPACTLFEQGHGGVDAFMNLWNLWVHHGCRAEHRAGLDVVSRMLRYSSERQDATLTLISSFTAAMANLWIGNYETAAEHENRALALYDFDRDRYLVRDYNHDPRNTLLSWGAIRVWALGYPDKARALSDAALAHARQVGHAFNLC